jgi:uncharacterized membrane protein YedE/YeeE
VNLTKYIGVESIMTIQILGALGLGLTLGYVMQRPQICFNRAYRTSTLQSDTTMLKTLAAAMVIQMVGFHTLVAVGVVKLNIVPGIWVAALVGGFTFGISFVFAQGCSTTMWYRIGNGNLGSLLALLGFAGGEVLTFNGPLRSLREALTQFEVRAPGDAPATLPNLLGISPWTIVVPLTLLGILWLVNEARNDGKLKQLGGWPWPVPGIILGALGTAAWWISQGTGWDYGVGVVGATGPILRMVWEGPSVLTWGSFLVLAMPVGGFLAAWSRGEFVLKTQNLGHSLRFVLSGLAMGISAAVAGGCNIGHTFTGAPTLALSSLLASATILLGALVGNWLRYNRLGNPLPEPST